MTSIPLTDLKQVVIFNLLEGESAQDTAVSKAGGIIDTLLKQKGAETIPAAPGMDFPQLKGGHSVYVIGHGDPNGFDGTLLGGFWTMEPVEFVKSLEALWSGVLLLASEVYLVACDIDQSKEYVTNSYAFQTGKLLLSKRLIQKVVYPVGPVSVKFNTFEQSVTAGAWYIVKNFQ